MQIVYYQYDAFGRRIAEHVTDTNTNHTQTTVFVWDGDVLAQEITGDKTVTYLYEPGSFVPLARIESREGLERYAADAVPLPQVTEWELPQGRNDPTVHLRAWRAHREQEQEARYWQWVQQKLEHAREESNDDRIHYYHSTTWAHRWN